MKSTYKKLNLDFDAEPNAPNPIVTENSESLSLTFLLNPFIWDNVKDDEQAKLIFNKVYAYRIGSPGSDNFKDFRYFDSEIDNYGFYQIENSKWKSDFPDDKKIVNNTFVDSSDLNHFVFFFRDNTFECIANEYEFIRTGKIYLEK